MLRPRIPATSPLLKRLQHSLRIAIVGSGPSGFYAAHDLLKQDNKNEISKVTMYEKLPTPFGLSRYGVAPDHPEVKNCEDTFTEAAQDERFMFLGNVTVGEDVSVKELKESYDGVVFAYGCTQGNKLGIQGEDLPGVINAHEFVAWYNENPDVNSSALAVEPPLDKTERVVIIGNGNVAMDIARLLLMPIDELQKTDISEKALKMMKKSKVKDIRIVARRGFLESAFATKEIRELLTLEKYGVKFNGIEKDIVDFLVPIQNKMERVHKRKLSLLLDYMKPVEQRRKLPKKFQIPDEYHKSWRLDYLLSPMEIKENSKDHDLVSQIKFQKNQLYQESPESPTKVHPIPESFVSFDTDLVITSLGFKGTPITGLDDFNIKFDTKSGIIVTENFKVLNRDNEPVPGLYATGWIKNAKKGPIVNTLIDSNTVTKTILDDSKQGRLNQIESIKSDDLEQRLIKENNAITWKDWETLNQFELKFGEFNGKSRWKIPQIEEMLTIIKDGNDIETKIKQYLQSQKV